jgi:hypothetical protein
MFLKHGAETHFPQVRRQISAPTLGRRLARRTDW